MQTNEQTDIASMSEVIIRYIGHDSFMKIWRMCLHKNIHTSWDWIHEIWEKVRDEKDIPNISDKDLLKSNELYEAIEYAVINCTKLEALTALFNFIQFINQLKQ